MKEPLSDFERWRASNAGREFSLFDYAYAVLSEHRMSADLVIALARMFWPEFIEVDGSVFAKELYSESKLSDIRNQPKTKAEIEFWMNLLCVDGLLDGLADTTSEHAEELAELLAASWNAKLKRDFPERRFVVKVVNDIDVGDICVVFTEEQGP